MLQQLQLAPQNHQNNEQNLTPSTIVEILDNYIIGQKVAKRAMAIALRNRWRRLQVRSDLQQEIVPKNILMIGPTGVGKTEISRRLAKIINAPFIKVEATKFTQVGYVGKDVDSIIRDLAKISYQKCHDQAMVFIQQQAEQRAEEKILDILLPENNNSAHTPDSASTAHKAKTREKLRTQLREGKLDEREISIQVASLSKNMHIMGPPGVEEMADQLQDFMSNLSQQAAQKKRTATVKQAKQELQIQAAHELVDEEEIRQQTVRLVEQGGIVFLDEIDKICKPSEHRDDVAKDGVQRDLLPLIEGTTVNTKYGNINTDHILFIASGAFHQSKPSDLIAELQGRLPIRVELETLTVNDFERILSEPKHSLLKQYSALMETDGVVLRWQKAAIQRIAEIACQVNEKNENIGARRLHTVLEILLNDVAFDAPDQIANEKITITSKMVDDKLQHLADDRDLSQFIL